MRKGLRGKNEPRAWQRMLSGRRLDLLDPSPMDIEIEDIAHGLARVARWNGQTTGEHAFSVAQHSVVVEDAAAHLQPGLSPKWRLAALLHDAPTRLAACAPRPRVLYVASSEEVGIQTGVAALIRQLEAHRACATWTYEPMPAEHHSTIFPTAALHGIRKVFAAPPSPAGP